MTDINVAAICNACTYAAVLIIDANGRPEIDFEVAFRLQQDLDLMPNEFSIPTMMGRLTDTGVDKLPTDQQLIVSLRRAIIEGLRMFISVSPEHCDRIIQIHRPLRYACARELGHSGPCLPAYVDPSQIVDVTPTAAV